MTEKPAEPLPEPGAAGQQAATSGSPVPDGAAARPGAAGSGAAGEGKAAPSTAGEGAVAASGRRAHRKQGGRSALPWRRQKTRPAGQGAAHAAAGGSGAVSAPAGAVDGAAVETPAKPSAAAGAPQAASATDSAKPGPDAGTAPASPPAAQDTAASKSGTAGKPAKLKTVVRNQASQKAGEKPARLPAEAKPAARKPAQKPAQASDRRSGRRGPLGIAAGVGLLALAGTAAAAGSVSGIGGAAAEVPAVPAAVAAGNFTGVCPEPLRLLDSAADETDPEFSPVSESARTLARAVVFSDLGGVLPGSTLAELGARNPLVTIAKSSGESSTEVRGSSDDGQTKLLAGVVSGQALSEPTVLSVEPSGGQQALAGAAMTYRAGDGDLRGLAAANCTAPANDFWLLGAATTVGTTAVLNLHNPTQTPSTVDLELVGTEGRIQAAGARGLLLAPGESRSIVLGGLAAKQDSLAVHVSTSGGPVSGTIQQSILRGLTPGGVELLTASADAAAEQVVTGVEVQGGKLAGSVRAQRGYETAGPALAVVVPGGQDARLQLQVFGKDGKVQLAGGNTITAAAGTVTEIPLDSLPAGTYSVRIASDVSVAAAARVSRATGKNEPLDFAWAPAAARLGSEHLAVVPGGAGSRLVFGAPAGAAVVKLVPVDRDGKPGKEQVLKVPAGTTVTVDPKAGGADPAAVVVSASGDPVYGSQILANAGRPDISVLPVPAGVQGRQTVPVYLGY